MEDGGLVLLLWGGGENEFEFVFGKSLLKQMEDVQM